MYILKNALKSITRSKGRNLLIGIIVAVIAVASCLSLSIRNAANTAEQSGREQLSVTGTISLDRQKLMSQAESGDRENMREIMQQYSNLSLSDMQKYAGSVYVEDFVYSDSTSVSAGDGIEPVDSTSTSGETSSTSGNGWNQQEMPGGGQGRAGGFQNMGNQGDFTVVGYSSEKAMTAFVNGTSKISDGTIFDMASSDLNCIISDELASFNGLSVGSTIILENPNQEDEVYTLTVTGIYSNEQSSSDGMGMRFSTAQDPANQIFMSYPALKTILDASAAGATVSTDEDTGTETTTALREQVSGTYYFADVAALESFKTDAVSMGLSDYYTVSSADASSYEQSLQPLKNLSKFATTMLLIVLLIGGVILIVFNIFNIRERKFEVGVLTAIGMKKRKVAFQFITELFVVTFVSLIIGTGIGAAVSVPTANAMLQSQVESQQSQSAQQEENFGRPGSDGNRQSGNMPGAAMMAGNFGNWNTQNVTYLSTINAVTNFTVVGQLLGIGILLTILSSCAAVVFVLRYEPLKILANRS